MVVQEDFYPSRYTIDELMVYVRSPSLHDILAGASLEVLTEFLEVFYV